MSGATVSSQSERHVFDSAQRNALARMVGRARELLKADFVDQLRRLGFQADGTVLDLSQIAGLAESERASGQELRTLLDHFITAEGGEPANGASSGRRGGRSEARAAAFDRLVRELGFTTFNRLIALRMAEERGLIVQSVGGGFGSTGFQVYQIVVQGALGGRVETYRAYVESLYDELAEDLPALFDRGNPESRVFPSERCLEDVLDLINGSDIVGLWGQDEAIGWVYQYYNDPAERKRMRDASSAPRNSRELAVRNQFFTPRYVVEFLTDNTLGRMWYEMRQGETQLREDCRYLVRRKQTVFLQAGEAAPNGTVDPATTEYVPYRARKDPRDIRVLDPACGSGHFLLYAFDLLTTMYIEAWEDTKSPASGTSGRSLRADYADLADLLPAVPALILRHNLHGIDIDPRACQIAGLSLWLRAQRAYQRQELKSTQRPAISRSNIVCAEPMPGEHALLDDYLTSVDARLQGLGRAIWQKMALAGEAGSLLKIETEINAAVEQARLEATRTLPVQVRFLTDGTTAAQQTFQFDSSEDLAFWDQAIEALRGALKEFSRRTAESPAARRRLFREDARQGFAFVDLCQNHFDVALMNPPFGEASRASKSYLEKTYPRSKNDVYAAFVERWLGRLTSGGLLGAITSRTGFFLSSFQKWREEILLKEARVTVFADLGSGVLDSAMVETAAYCLERVME